MRTRQEFLGMREGGDKAESGKEKNSEYGKATVDDEWNIRRGNEAIEKVLSNKNDIANAMHREGLGDISFLWGVEGRGAKLKDGYGISHLIARRKRDGIEKHGMNETQAEFYALAVVRKMPEVIAKGEEVKHGGPDLGTRVALNYEGYTAVLSLYRDGKRDAWLLTGWDDD